MKEIKYWATSYALKADDLYIGFPTKKYLKIDKRDLPTCYENEVQFMYGKILRYFLHGKAREVLYMIEQYSTIILLVLFATDLTSIIISPIIGWITKAMLWLVNAFYGLF